MNIYSSSFLSAKNNFHSRFYAINLKFINNFVSSSISSRKNYTSSEFFREIQSHVTCCLFHSRGSVSRMPFSEPLQYDNYFNLKYLTNSRICFLNKVLLLLNEEPPSKGLTPSKQIYPRYPKRVLEILLFMRRILIQSFSSFASPLYSHSPNNFKSFSRSSEFCVSLVFLFVKKRRSGRRDMAKNNSKQMKCIM